MSRPRRGYSNEEIDEYVRQDQARRADERRRNPDRWRLVIDPEWSEVFGPVWQRRED